MLLHKMQVFKQCAIGLFLVLSVGIALLSTTVGSMHIESSIQLHLDRHTYPVPGNGNVTHESAPASKRATADDVMWTKAVCKGQKLFQALTTNADKADRFIAPVNSPWNGALVNELKAWGYHDISSKKDLSCHFDLERVAFTALGIDYQSKGEGGPNRCFAIEHQDGPNTIKDVNGRIPPAYRQVYTGPTGMQYQATRGYATIGINPVDGVVYFINRKAPATAAKEFWTNRANNPIRSEELPRLSASSDFAWGFWNRANPPEKVKNIQKIMSLEIINEQTLFLIERALESIEQPPGQPKVTQPPVWPGVTFIVHGDSDALALLGSPNGLGAGYFLAQHKAQLGNKVISKITVWQATMFDLPNLLFWVADELEPEEAEEPEDLEEPEDPGTPRNVPSRYVVKREVELSRDDKHFFREHVFRARL